jgi:CRP/FNR family transcriptional regulator, cyclic AMP receptor protein
VIGRARMATQSARSMALLDVYGRLVQLLESASRQLADGARVIEPVPTHAAMAARVGCSREMVSRLMKDLAGGGYLAVEGVRLRLCRPMPPRW